MISQISVDEYRDIVTTISNLFYVKRRWFFNKALCLVLFLTTVPIVVIFGAIAAENYTDPYGDYNYYLFTRKMSLIMTAVGLMFPIIHYLCTLKVGIRKTHFILVELHQLYRKVA